MAVSNRKQAIIAILAVAAVCLHLLLRFFVATGEVWGQQLFQLPLLAILLVGGIPLVSDLLIKLLKGQFGSDLLAGISIVTSALLGEHLAGALVVLMLSGGEALEAYAVRSASSVLEALARRMPPVAHHKPDGTVADVSLDEVAIGDTLVVGCSWFSRSGEPSRTGSATDEGFQPAALQVPLGSRHLPNPRQPTTSRHPLGRCRLPAAGGGSSRAGGYRRACRPERPSRGDSTEIAVRLLMRRSAEPVAASTLGSAAIM